MFNHVFTEKKTWTVPISSSRPTGANSTIRTTGDFGTTVTPLTNKFAWFGTSKVFNTLTQTFVQNEAGSFNAHHYRHSAQMSTFVVECDPATWARAGFERMDEAATLAYCEKVFADDDV